MNVGDPDRLADRIAANPYRRFPELDAAAAALLLADDLRAHRTALVDEGDEEARVVVSRVAWDCERLGVEIGRIEAWATAAATDATIERLARVARGALTQHRIAFASARLPSTDARAQALCQAIGLHPAGELQNLALDDPGPPAQGARPAATLVARDAGQGDLEAIRALAETGYENRLLTEARLDGARVRALYGEWAANDLRGRTPITLLALAEGAAAGFISVGLLRAPSGIGFVDLVVVAPWARRRGVGRALMEAAIPRLRERGAHRIELNVAATNGPAIALYRGMGFAPRMRFTDYSGWFD